MTIRIIQQWNGYAPDQIVRNLAGDIEQHLVSLGFASYELGDRVDRLITTSISRPHTVYALAGNQSATIQWIVSHAGDLNSFTIIASPGGHQVIVPATGIRGSAVISGLTNGQSYTFTVTANNAIGSSVPSLPSNSVTPTATPSSILPVTRGLEFWWSASQVASPPANGAPLTSLVDMSGNGYNAAGVGTGNGGTWVSNWSNGKPAVALNGSNQYYHTLASGLYGGMRGTDNTIYVVYDVAANANAAGATGGRVLSLERPNTQQGVTGGGFAYGVGSTAGQAAGEVYNNSSQYTGATFSGSNFGLNTPVYAAITKPGGLRVNGAAISGFIDGTLDWGAGCPWTFGAMYGGGYNKYMQGRIAEIIIFNVVHTPAEIAAMEAYLATRI